MGLLLRLPPRYAAILPLVMQWSLVMLNSLTCIDLSNLELLFLFKFESTLAYFHSLQSVPPIFVL